MKKSFFPVLCILTLFGSLLFGVEDHGTGQSGIPLAPVYAEFTEKEFGLVQVSFDPASNFVEFHSNLKDFHAGLTLEIDPEGRLQGRLFNTIREPYDVGISVSGDAELREYTFDFVIGGQPYHAKGKKDSPKKTSVHDSALAQIPR